jgi:hypothetical protein
LILALISGVQTMHQAIATASLTETEPAWLIDELTGLF